MTKKLVKQIILAEKDFKKGKSIELNKAEKELLG